MSSQHARREGRELAFQLLFQADQNGVAFDEIIRHEEQFNELTRRAWRFGTELAAQAQAAMASLDPVIERLASGWTVPRLPACDRALLRLAVFEMVNRDDIPLSVSINEAVELAKQYGTDESPRFINGVLGSLARELGEEDSTEANPPAVEEGHGEPTDLQL